MHRSGTSAVAGALEGLGIYLGEPGELLPPDAGNRAGYFEPVELIALNDRILARWGAHLYDPRLAERPEGLADLPEELRRAMQAYAARWRDRARPFAWKDPRLCLTYRFWRPLLPTRGIVVVTRHPAEIADSLAERDHMDRRGAIALWESYAQAAVRELRGVPCHPVHHEELMADPAGTLERLRAFAVGLEPVLEGSVAAALARIDVRLRHHARPRGGELSERQVRLYEALREARPVAEPLDGELAALLDACSSQASGLREERLVRAQLEAKVARLQAKNEGLRKRLASAPRGGGPAGPGWLMRRLRALRGLR